MTKVNTVRLILGDQLNAQHSWFEKVDPGVCYLIAELHQEQHYVRHHVQKTCAFLHAMEQFASQLANAGHQVVYRTLDDTEGQSLEQLLGELIQETRAQRFEFQHPDEQRLATQLSSLAQTLSIETRAYDSEHFIVAKDEIGIYFTPDKHNRMETFYRKMRKRLQVLMDDQQPSGGKWNFDSSNRSSFKKDDLTEIPQPLCFANDVSHILARIEKHAIPVFGKAETQLLWPTTRKQSLQQLDYFCENCLPLFGKFQDAMTENSAHSWSLYHSRLSFSLNAKLISPLEVIERSLKAYNRRGSDISIEQIEGFVRQIIGWREYVRGVYWVNQPHYSRKNFFNAKRKLPAWYWTGDTKMSCLRAAVTQSLEYSYAHHIQRLMVTGNFALLAGIDPEQVEEWYLGIYIDAIEWVEQPNTRSMTLFADGGWVATKPYAASGNYINKMSDHCKACVYSPKKKTESDACPLNSLYWNFLDRNRSKLQSNPRMAFPYKTLQRMSEDQVNAINNKARELLSVVDSL